MCDDHKLSAEQAKDFTKNNFYRSSWAEHVTDYTMARAAAALEYLRSEFTLDREFTDTLDSLVCDEGCNAGRDKTQAEALLPDTPNKVVTLMAFEDCGGHCDCEILVNVDPYEGVHAAAQESAPEFVYMTDDGRLRIDTERLSWLSGSDTAPVVAAEAIRQVLALSGIDVEVLIESAAVEAAVEAPKVSPVWTFLRAWKEAGGKVG